MSVDLFVFVRRADVPTTAQWQVAIDALAVDLRLDPDVEIDTASGYWPIELDGADSGFEFFIGDVDSILGEPPPQEVGDRDVVAQFVTHSDMAELRCALYAASALATAADGVALDGESGALMTGRDLVAEARSIPD